MGTILESVTTPLTEKGDELAAEIPTAALSLAGFRAWATSDEFPERLHASFINREIVIDMSPEELETHNKVKSEICIVVGMLNREVSLGEFFSDGILLTNVQADLSTEPDATLVSWKSFEEGKARLVPRKQGPGQYVELEGTPDWVLEVVSRSSVRKDNESLREAYHRAGIPEYWIIDARFDEISFQILHRRRDRYVVVAPRDGWHRSTFLRRSFRLSRRRNRVGRWTYSLEYTPA